jgi:hypothetical protein
MVTLWARLHYDKNRNKLVHFKEQKKIFCIFKTLLTRLTPVKTGLKLAKAYVTISFS